MAYTPAKTWSDGDILNATDVMANLDGVKQYSRHLETGALKTSTPWVDTSHVMEGQYEPTTNMHSMVTGTYGGQNSGGLFSRATFASRWNTFRKSYSEQSILLPQTSLTVDLRRKASVFFQWWMQVQVKDNLTGLMPTGSLSPRTSFWFAINDTVAGTGVIQKSETKQGVPGPSNSKSGQVLLDGTFNTNGFYTKSSTTGQSSVGFGITCRCTGDMAHCLAWGVSVEVFYL